MTEISGKKVSKFGISRKVVLTFQKKKLFHFISNWNNYLSNGKHLLIAQGSFTHVMQTQMQMQRHASSKMEI